MLEESTTYQAILRRGRQEDRQEGRLEDRKEVLLDLLREKFGVVPAGIEGQILQSTNSNWLQQAIRQTVKMQSLLN